MIFNGCGEGSQIERNKNRISRCKELAKDELLELYTDTFVNGLVSGNCDVKSNIEYLFYENISYNILENNIKDVKTFTEEELEEFKDRLYNQYKKRPTSGYLMCVATQINNIISSRV